MELPIPVIHPWSNGGRPNRQLFCPLFPRKRGQTPFPPKKGSDPLLFPRHLTEMAMAVSRGWQFFMHPGPTNIPERVRQAMARPAVDFTGPEFVAMRDRCLERM